MCVGYTYVFVYVIVGVYMWSALVFSLVKDRIFLIIHCSIHQAHCPGASGNSLSIIVWQEPWECRYVSYFSFCKCFGNPASVIRLVQQLLYPPGRLPQPCIYL